VKARATTTVDVYRDADPDDSDGYLDPTETPGPPIHENIPFSIIERTQRVADATAGSMVPITYLVGRCGAEHDVQQGDRVFDHEDDSWYAVSQVTWPQSPVALLDRRMELRRVQ